MQKASNCFPNKSDQRTFLEDLKVTSRVATIPLIKSVKELFILKWRAKGQGEGNEHFTTVIEQYVTYWSTKKYSRGDAPGHAMNDNALESNNRVFKNEYTFGELLSIFPLNTALKSFAHDSSRRGDPRNVNQRLFAATPTIDKKEWLSAVTFSENIAGRPVQQFGDMYVYMSKPPAIPVDDALRLAPETAQDWLRKFVNNDFQSFHDYQLFFEYVKVLQVYPEDRQGTCAPGYDCTCLTMGFKFYCYHGLGLGLRNKIIPANLIPAYAKPNSVLHAKKKRGRKRHVGGAWSREAANANEVEVFRSPTTNITTSPSVSPL
jgi:hypothetical protein